MSIRISFLKLNCLLALLLLTGVGFAQQAAPFSPNAIRQDNSKYNQNNAYKISVISTIVSGCSVIASLVIALTVK